LNPIRFVAPRSAAKGMFRVLTLGQLNLLCENGTSVQSVLAQPKRLALLLYLVAEGPGDYHRRDHLLALFWPESDDEHARGALRQAVSYLRRSLGAQAIQGRGSEDLCVPAGLVSCDVVEFEQACRDRRWSEALALYRGEFLPGFSAPGVSNDLEDWLDRRRARVRQSAVQAALALAEEKLASNELLESISAARHAVAIDAACEAGWRRLMELLDRTGDSGAALAAYEELVRHVGRFDAAPAPTTRALQERIRARCNDSAALKEVKAPEVLVAPNALPETADVAAATDLDELPDRSPAALLRPTSGTPSPPAYGVRRQARQRICRYRAAAVLAVIVLGGTMAMMGAAERASSEQPGSPAATSTMAAVFPFRTEGADSTLAPLGIGVADLLAARLDGLDGHSVVDPPRVLSHWRRSHQSVSYVMTIEEAIRLGMMLGADQVVVGSVIGTSGRLTLSATLVDIDGSSSRAYALATGAPDSLTFIVDQLASQLLLQRLGKTPARAEAMGRAPFAAVRAYVSGQRAYLRGQYAAAGRHFRQALSADPAFAHAAVALTAAVQWEHNAEVHAVAHLARDLRHLLPPGDQLFLDALSSQHLAVPLPHAERIAAWERALSARPDRWDAWFWYGDMLYHWGPVLAMASAWTRASAAFTRSLELNASDAALGHLLDLAVARRDTTEVRRVASEYFARLPAGDAADFLRWRVAVALGDEPERDRLRLRFHAMETSSLQAILGAAQLDAVALDDADLVASVLRGRAATAAGQRPLYHLLHHYALNRGRPREALQYTEHLGEIEPGAYYLQVRVLDGLLGGGSAEAAEDAARQLRRLAAPTAAGMQASPPSGMALCLAELWGGDRRGATAAAARIRRPARDLDPAAAALHRGCATLLEAWSGAPDEAGTLAELERLNHAQAPILPGWEQHHVVHLFLATLLERQGRPADALRLLRQRPYHYSLGVPYLATFLREEGRLALALGDTAGAERARQHYRALRTKP
jgi:DNA-binding SARP family transcriptional activator/tetratricopeptide (TPR) repeat protein/TolB-like protein